MSMMLPLNQNSGNGSHCGGIIVRSRSSSVALNIHMLRGAQRGPEYMPTNLQS
ncbi:hypothetical protein D3C76_1441270 [compost metagenome]